MTITAPTPDILGERQSGPDVRTQNGMACGAVANIVKSSLGPSVSTSMGLDLSKGIICNKLEYGAIEPSMSKVKIIQFATEAAITILRIDDMIKLTKEERNEE